MPAGGDRIKDRLEELFRIGGGPGANRPGLSEAEDEAHDLVAGWMREAGLEVERDAAGNLVGRLVGERPELEEVWTGSHLDSVPAGGRFDGALGVVAGLEAVERVGRQPCTLGVVAFRDEEGCRFGTGCLGSRALCGLVGEKELELRDTDGVSVREALARLGVDTPPPPGKLPSVFVEAHVEQGPRLEQAGAPLGVVTGIVGTARGEAVFEGVTGHAGTVPMAFRNDALCEAAAFVLRVRETASAIEGAVATVGRVEVEPGAANVIPGRVRVSVDARAPDRERLDALVAALGVDLRRTEPVAMAPGPTAVLREELERLGLEPVGLVSGAGHDAGILAQRGVPTAMLFVRSLAGGVSHAPEEETSTGDVALCVDALAGALARLAAA